MKAAALFGARDLRLVEVDTPVPAGDQVLVAPARVGICGSDVHFYAHGRVGAFDLRGPQVIGHEAAGIVVGVGPAVADLAIGDRVAIEPGHACGTCRECRGGMYNLCPRIVFMGMPPTNGSLAELTVVPERFAHQIPAAMTLEEGALLEPLSVAIWSCTRAEVALGERVLVAGAGPIGVLVARVAAAAGAAEIVIVDIDGARLAAIEGAPRTRIVDVSAGWDRVGDDFDCYLECTGATTALADGLAHLRRRGRAVLVGVPAVPEVPIPSVLTRFRELNITTVHRYAHTWPIAITLVSSGLVRVADLVGSHFSLDDVVGAFEAATAKTVGLKAMIVIGDPKAGTVAE